MDWILSDPLSLAMTPLTALGIYLGVVAAVRLAGLRSFSKMSSFDFAMTVAIGSVVASTVMARTPSLLQGLVGVASIFGLQYVVARWRVAYPSSMRPIDNEPLLLMDRGGMLEANMKSARVTRQDLIAKLRESNVLHRSQIRAVVMETTGDISVLHAADPGQALEEDFLLAGVRRTP